MDYEKPSQPDLLSATQALVLDYVELMKPRLVMLSLFSTFVGFFLASNPKMELSLLFATLSGTGLVAAASMVLNQWMEKDTDALMLRTHKRPIPSGRVEPVEALAFGLALAALGLGILELAVHSICSAIAALTLCSYLFIYTPLKKVTPLSTVVGAIPGALPPLIGWSAAGNIFSLEAWIIFSIIFFWQMPHFYSIAWIYREDYARAGIRVLSVLDADGQRTSRQSFYYILALIPVSLSLTLLGLTGPLYFFGACILGILLLVISVYSFKAIDRSAKYLFRASVIYLTLLFLLMILDKAR